MKATAEFFGYRLFNSFVNQNCNNLYGKDNIINPLKTKAHSNVVNFNIIQYFTNKIYKNDKYNRRNNACFADNRPTSFITGRFNEKQYD